MIKIICVGKIKEKYFVDAIKEYEKRLSKYTKLEIIEVMDFNISDINKALKIEQDAIIKHINEKDYLILLDLDGIELSSIELSEELEKIEQINSNLVFVIGGSNGVSDALKQMAKKRISFSRLTFPHQLFRVLLLEQLYRSYKIRYHESYHK